MLYNVILWFNYYANSKMHIFTKVYKKFHNNILHIINKYMFVVLT